MDMTQAGAGATVAVAIGAILGYAFAAGGKNAAILLNTKEIAKVAKENEDVRDTD